MMKRNNRGFSLIELLVVLAILALLVGLVGPRVMKQLGGAKADTAVLQIADLQASLDIYYLDIGVYPTSTQGLTALIEKPADVSGWNGPYLKKKKVPLDPWGHAYHYVSPSKHGDYDLYSLGADNQQGGSGDDQDITSWE
ncbi:MAG: type II secretion system protein GspG [Methylophaga sp.]|uniref:type II secretion system major pseudopilin GspG n=1 Tax=Methylophaga sp. UBA678 TaxID=1946901 RepID=UPI000C4A5AC6|nr:type II secretion system major pseudopilin GspG [Methylophaga sp. UBA678]MAX51037.1 type II secretion system protein GspG [Methylophaga sp.]|tara:strand:+ start:13004 stop:13423 length:420 start_codon:yes stop_codon:yes gene_type:complete